MAREAEYDEDPALGPEARAWVKEQQQEITYENLSARALYLFEIYTLRRGGFPFSAEDLDPEDWEALGWMEMMFARLDQERLVKMIFGDGDK